MILLKSFLAFTTSICLYGLFFTSCQNKSVLNNDRVFTLYNIDLESDIPFSDPVAREIKKQTGVSLEIHHPKSLSLQAQKLFLSQEIKDEDPFS